MQQAESALPPLPRANKTGRGSLHYDYSPIVLRFWMFVDIRLACAGTSASRAKEEDGYAEVVGGGGGIPTKVELLCLARKEMRARGLGVRASLRESVLLAGGLPAFHWSEQLRCCGKARAE